MDIELQNWFLCGFLLTSIRWPQLLPTPDFFISSYEGKVFYLKFSFPLIRMPYISNYLLWSLEIRDIESLLYISDRSMKSKIMQTLDFDNKTRADTLIHIYWHILWLNNLICTVMTTMIHLSCMTLRTRRRFWFRSGWTWSLMDRSYEIVSHGTKMVHATFLPGIGWQLMLKYSGILYVDKCHVW